MSRFFSFLILFVVAIATDVHAQSTKVEPMSQLRIDQAADYESHVRAGFKEEMGHEPHNSIEFLAWLDRKAETSRDFTNAHKDAMVQTFGATLGVVLIRDFGGRWVTVPSENNAPGVDLPSSDVAFVFNRAARRIFDGDQIGFVAFYKATESHVRGTRLPKGIGEKRHP